MLDIKLLCHITMRHWCDGANPARASDHSLPSNLRIICKLERCKAFRVRRAAPQRTESCLQIRSKTWIRFKSCACAKKRVDGCAPFAKMQVSRSAASQNASDFDTIRSYR